MKRLLLVILLIASAFGAVRADEGMWMPRRISRKVGKQMKERGLTIPLESIYSEKSGSLKDAIVCFGGFCSGVVVSNDGLIFTNHHCGFESVQAISTVEDNFLEDGFIAQKLDEEVPCPELYVRFLVRTENVTRRVLRHVKSGMSEDDRSAAIDEEAQAICDEVTANDSTLVGEVDSFFGGNEYWLSVYRDYDDVRLVLAPPLSVGKFGGDTDNWEWPRHTGDFCVFRVYADRNNRPAEYSVDNVPYHPERYAPISLAGYNEGDYSMTIGYPGRTERYLSSYGVEEKVECINKIDIDVYSAKLAVMKKAMDSDKEVYIKYASKFEMDANVLKSCEEENKSVRKLGVIQTKRDRENIMARDTTVANILKGLRENYEKRREAERAMVYYSRAFFSGAELPVVAMNIINGDMDTDSVGLAKHAYKLAKMYSDYDKNLDKQIFVTMAEKYKAAVDTKYLPVFYQEADSLFNGDMSAYAESVFSNSRFTSLDSMRVALTDTTFIPMDDIAANLALEILFGYFTMNADLMEWDNAIARGERLLTEAMRQRPVSISSDYPDANMTMRLSYGAVRGYNPRDGVEYNFFTTAKGVLEKSREYAGNPEFYIQPGLAALLKDRSTYGDYSDSDGDMHVCFVTDNDITGGNSGSAMFNGRGELIGLAFDGNSDDMSVDLMYNGNMQRCIGVDIRYVLYIIEKFGQDTRIFKELDIRK
jgi:hypothetical protein